MKIETYIAQLLYRYQCVTIPGFGAFLTEMQSSQLNASTNSFYPPTKLISFNSNIKNNDGLLANHIAESLKISYSSAVSAITAEVANWKNSLDEAGVIHLKNIGDIHFNADKNIVFTPENQHNFLTSSFGLSPFISPEVKRENFEAALDRLQIVKDQETHEEEVEANRLTSSGFLKYAAIFVLGLGITGSIGYPIYENEIATKTQLVENAVQKKVQDKIQQATFVIQNPLPAVVLTVDSAAVETVEAKMPYHIMAGAFRSAENAQKAYNELVKAGYKARVLDQNKHGLFPVLYGSYQTMMEAKKAQKEIQLAENPDAWILIESL